MSEGPRTITPEEGAPVELAPGVALRVFVSGGANGSKELTVCSATFPPGAELPCHTHPTSEVIYTYSGYANAIVDDRAYILRPGDLLHVPAGVRHLVRNASGDPACLYTFFPTSAPERDSAPEPESSHFMLVAPPDAPERIIRAGDSWRPATEWPISLRKSPPDGFIAEVGSERVSVAKDGSLSYEN